MNYLFEKYNKKDIILFAITLDTILVNIIMIITIYLLKENIPQFLMYLLIPLVIYNIGIILIYLVKLISFKYEANKQDLWLNISMIITALLSIVFSGLLYIIISLINFPF